MTKDSEKSADNQLAKKYYKLVMIVGIIVASLIAAMPWMGTEGMADPDTAESGGLWLNFLGGFHPLLLHLPIGALMLVFCMEALGLITKGKYKPRTTLAVAFAATTAVLAVVLGYFWYLTGDYPSEMMEEHKRDGVIFTVLMILTFMVKYSAFADVTKWTASFKTAYFPLLLITGAAMFSSSHKGGDMVHGDPLNQLPSKILAKRELELNKPVVTDPVIYTNIVHNILQNKCISCHGDDKQKGDLRLDSMAAMIEGGSDHISLEPGDVEESYMLTTLTLPLEDDMRMPPKEKEQTTPEERMILTWWVEIGAPESTKLSEVKVPDEITAAIATLKTPEELIQIAKAKREQEAALVAARKADRERLQSSWDKINAKFPGSLRYTSQEDTALTFSTVSYRKSFTEEDLDILSDIAEDIYELDISSTAITDAGVSKIKGFKNLRNLKLNETEITDEALSTIAELPALEKLNLYGTIVSDSGVQLLHNHPTLVKVYLWNTKATDSGARELQEALRKRADTNRAKLAKEFPAGKAPKVPTPEVLLGVSSE